MAHIERGDNRQYFSQESLIDTSGDMAKATGNAVDAGVSITQKAQESTLANYQIDLSAKFLEKNTEINTKYQADPTNPERETELQEAFDMMAEEYKVNPLVAKQWGDIKSNVYGRYKTYNSEWMEKQQESNISTNLQNGYQTLTNQVSMLGMNGAGLSEINLVKSNGIESLRNGSINTLGEMTVNNFLKDSDHDIMATYISGLAVNNPLEAQKLLKDKNIQLQIGNADTLEKLDNYVVSSLENQHKKVAVNELGNTLRSMNSKDAENIIDGKANLNQVMKFVETHKNLPEGSKDLILDIYGLGTKTEYYYDKDKKKIVKDPEPTGGRGGRRGRSSGSLESLKKLSKMQKIELADSIEQQMQEAFFFGDTEKVNPKNAVKNGTHRGINSTVLQRLQQVAEAQGVLDTAYRTGIIDKNKRQKMMNNYVQPMTDYLEANLMELDERKGWFGSKVGYGNLVKSFNVEGAGRHKAEMRKNLLTAQGYYYDALDKARQKKGFSSIYELEKLSKNEQEVIYRTASDNAINYARKYGSHPEVFFKQEYPQLYTQGVSLFGVKDGKAVAKQVAKEVYNTPEGQKPDVSKIMSDAIVNMKSYKKQQASELVHSIVATNKLHPENKVLDRYEIESRASNLGLNLKQLTNDAYSKRVSPQMYLIYLENLKRNKK